MELYYGCLERTEKFLFFSVQERSLKTEDECMEYLKNINTPKFQDIDIEHCEGKLTL